MESWEEVLRQVEKLAESRVNDAVRLAFLTGEEMELLDGLDLSAVTEFKRNKDGGVEIKFVDRLAALQWLLEQKGGHPEAKELRQAIATGAAQVWGEET